ncbi:MAG: glycine cleavage T C-terminal barrel domain-containing protein [Ignavibacteriaceae bacterium]
MTNFEHNEISLVQTYFESLGFHPVQRNGEAHFYTYSSTEEEYKVLMQGVGFRLLPASLLELQGKDVLDFLHRITTNDLKSLPVNEFIKTIFTNEKGRILDSVSVLNFGEKQLLIGNTGTQQKLLLWLQRYIIMDDVKVTNADERYSVFEVFGPQAKSFMTLLCGEQCKELRSNEIRMLNVEDFSFSVIANAEARKMESFFIIALSPNAIKLVQYALQNKGLFDFGLIGEDAYGIYRIEKGILSEKELNDHYNPHEAKLLDEVSFTKGCYIGQEVIARLATYDKVQKFLCGFVFIDSTKVDKDFLIVDDELNEIGTITSSVYSLSLQKTIGLGYLKKDFILENKILKAIGKNSKEEVSVNVHSLPFKD